MQPTTQDEYRKKLAEFKSTHPKAPIAYCEDTLLREHHLQFIHVYVDLQILSHFGHRVASRIGDSHHVLKQYIMTSIGGLCVV
jgi:hypothetical protein